MITWKLNTLWDVSLDEFGDIATATGDERLAQDVASSVRVFRSELIGDVDRGVDYNKPDTNRDSLNNQMNEQAMLVEGVKSSVVVFKELENRILKPIIYVTNEENEQVVVGG